MSENTQDSLVEGFARVVAVQGGDIVLEPEQTTACGHCVSSTVCGIGSNASRIHARRFTMVNTMGLGIGDRVVVGVSESSLLRASIVAYGLPLVAMLTGMIVGQQSTGEDVWAMAGAAAGLAIGLVVARVAAKIMAVRGEVAPKLLRRLRGPAPGDGCHTV